MSESAEYVRGDLVNPGVVLAAMPAFLDDLGGQRPHLGRTVVDVLKTRSLPWAGFVFDPEVLGADIYRFLMNDVRTGLIPRDRVFAVARDEESHVAAYRSGVRGLVVDPDLERVSDARAYLEGIALINSRLETLYGTHCLGGRDSLPVLLGQRQDDPYGLEALMALRDEGLVVGCLDATPTGSIAGKYCAPRKPGLTILRQADPAFAWQRGILPVVFPNVKTLFECAAQGDRLAEVGLDGLTSTPPGSFAYV